MIKTMTAALAVAALALAGCGSDDDTEGSTASTAGEAAATTTVGGVPDSAVAFLDALAEGDVTSVGSMADHTLPGSPAALYATYMLASARYDGRVASATNEVQGDQVEHCVESMASDTETVCTMYGAFEVDDGGLLISFSTDGSPVSDRIRAGDPAGMAADAVNAAVVVSYQTARGDLFVAVDFSNRREGIARVDDCSATYLGPDGRQLNQACVSYLPEVQPGATASVVFGIEQAAPGGTLTVGVSAEREPGSGDFYSDISLNLAVPA